MIARVLVIVSVAVVAAACGGATPAAPSTTPPPPPVVTPAPVPTPAPIPRPAGFDAAFWSEFAHGTKDNPARLPLSRLTSAPTLYLLTVDDDGVAVDPVTLSVVEAALVDVAPAWGGGRLGLAGVVRSTVKRDGAPGTLTVHWSSTAVLGRICGRSTVGIDGGWLQFNYHSGIASCGCNGSAVSPRSAKHELGHAFGYWHTSSVDDVMDPTISTCDARPSAREVLHAMYAYQLPNGSTE